MANIIIVHGDKIKEKTEHEKLEELRALRLLTLQIILRWLILTPADTGDLAPLLDAAAQGTGREQHIDQAGLLPARRTLRRPWLTAPAAW
ncbi:hypothetical protein ABTZ58_32845 [Streptomyces sp. NPDC094143]|uniref:hypothetical protein n=1 Tax=Streptomyces sp. NPDC094143 TaxID=3155310 RepID=UPI003333EB5D